MKRSGTLSVVAFWSSMLVLSTGQTCHPWVPAPIQTDPDSLYAPGGTPLGFRSLILPGDDSDLPGPCVRVFYDNPTSINNIFIPVQSTLSNLCVQVLGAQERTCGTSGIFFCDTVQLIMDPDTNRTYVDIEFSCPSSCSSTDVLFFYKVETESLDADDESWCDNRNWTLPSSLPTTPPPTTISTPTTVANCSVLSIENGNVTQNTMVGSVATYTCDSGYTLQGNGTRTCQANSSWTGANPVCTVVSCIPLTDPMNGDVTVDNNTFNSQAIYTCNAEFVLVGESSRTCQANATWTGEQPICSGDLGMRISLLFILLAMLAVQVPL